MNEIYQSQAYPYEGGIRMIEPPEPDIAGQDTQRTSKFPVKLDSDNLETRTQAE